MTVDLETLKTEITALGERIKEFKSQGDGVDAATVKAAVDELLTKKQLYADSNNGIGVDGKPFEKPLTKAEKKAKAKAEKAAAAAGGDGAPAAAQPGPAKPEPDPNSINAQKKAAKKEAKKAAKQAIKSGGGGGAGAGAAEGGAKKKDAAPAAAAAAADAAVPAAAAAAAVAGPSGMGAIASNFAGNPLLPMQLAINPNHGFLDRALVALSAAVISNTAVDLELVADHRRPHSALGTAPADGGVTITGDVAIARYLLQRAHPSRRALLIPADPARRALVDAWVDYATSLSRLPEQQRINAVALSLEHTLGGGKSAQTYLVGESMTLADICMFAAIGFPTQAGDKKRVYGLVPDAATSAKRWLGMLAGNLSLHEATQMAVGINTNREAAFDASFRLEPLVNGMNILEGATPGRVVTRFPPEPSGYLHIGHAKAALLNDYYATRYRGRLLLRFDDTNPSKEKEEFENSIVEDLKTLGIQHDNLSYTSDYFDVIADYAIQLIKEGKAFMDDTPQEEMQKERIERLDSKHRNMAPEEALEKFQLLRGGTEEGARWCLRGKIDMKSDNGTMRDPVFFRQNLTPHHRTGTKFKAYPTYDLACPIVDSIEGVTHALRTTEYNDRDEQYQWVLRALNLRQVRIHAFARVNFVNTVLSKRKLTWFVENGHVTGWDDARFPTVRGVVRRGVNIAALRGFIYSQGASRRVVNMDWTVFWSENKKEIDKTSKRFMAVDKETNVSLKITNAPKESDYAYVQTDYHPKDPSLGNRALRISNEVLLEAVDVEGMVVGESFVLMRWGVFRITKVDGGLEAEFVPDGDFKAAKRKVSWVASVANNTPTILTEFDNLVSKDKLEEDDKFEDYINPHTMAETAVIGDSGLKTLNENDVIQLERRGYYRVDRPYVSAEKPLILYTIPDGKAKAMSGQATKLAHR